MIKNIDIKYKEKLAKYSTIKIGGEAKMMVFPKDVKELKKCLKYSRGQNEKVFVLGNGSNTLFDDAGFDGIVVNMKNFDKIKIYKTGVYVGAGINLFSLNQELCQNKFTGLEWSYGIPGSVGGFIFMNGGSFGHEIADYVEYVDILKDDKVERLHRKHIDFSYRHSGIDGIILGARLNLQKGEENLIRKKMQDFFEKKKSLQPYDLPSLGSVFKRIQLQNEVLIPAKMIDSMGFKGVKIGGAEVSRKHAGFIVNDGRATAEDVKRLILFLRDKLNEIDINLETEIVIVNK